MASSRRRAARVAAALAALAGVVNLVSALLPAEADRLQVLDALVPGIVSEGATVITAAAGIGLLLLAGGLRRRQRLAWLAAVALLGGSAVLNLTKGLDVEEALLELCLAGLLAVQAGQFNARQGPLERRPVVAPALLVVLVTGAYATLGLLANAGAVAGPLSVARALQEAGRMAVGLGSGLGLEGRFGRFFPASVAAVFYFGGLVVAARVLAPALVRPGRDPGLARAVAASGDSLAYFALRDDRVSVRGGESLVSWAPVGVVALAAGDPLGPPAHWPTAVAAFLDQATAQGRIAATLGCGTLGAHAYRAAGLACIYLGDEAVLDLEGFSLEGRAVRIARQSWHRGRRAGLTATVCRVGDLDPGQRAALHALSARWRGAAPERGFSMALGRLLDPRDPGGFLVVGRAAGGRLLGFLHLVPWGDDGASLDVMRRERDAPAILNDFLVVEAARRLPALGVRRLSLNFAFQRAVLEAGAGRHIPLRARTTRWALCRLTRQFPVETLYRFNKKFAPAWQPRYLAIQAPEDLPTVAVACLKAEGLLAPESWGFSRRFTGVSSGLAYKGPGRIQAAQESDRTMPESSVRPGGGRRPADPIVAAGARLAGAAIRASGRGQGATLPGLLAERIAPGIAARRAARLDRVVLVSGTNGKTTTTAMLAAALAADGRRVASNAAGSNLYRGLVTALLAAGPATQDAVLEVDEAVLAKAVQELRPRLVVLLNLTRDQLDRHYEVGGLARRWRQAVAALAPGATVVANGAEPPTAWAAQAAPSALLVRVEGGGLGRDHAGCPACGGLLSRTGSESCGHCGWAPGPASVRVRRDGHQARLDGPGGSWPVRLPVASDGSAVDVAAAWAAATRLGVDPAAALATIAGIGTVQGRYATCSWRGVRLRLLLAKNPAGWDEALSAADDRRRPAVVAVNAGIPDGRDTSWLWDVDMARLHDRPLVTATGQRAEDVALRLEVAGVPCRIVRPLAAAIAGAGGRPGQREVDLFADYTSFRQAQELIGRRG